MSDLDQLFEAMAGATGSSSGVFFTEGNYKVELKEVEFRPNGFKGKSVIFRFTVTESNNPAHPVGSTRVWINKLDKKKDENIRTMADIKSLIFALTGHSVTEVGSPEVNPKAHEQAVACFMAAIDETHAKKSGIAPDALIGCEAKLEVMKIITRPSPKYPQGGEYSRHVWDPVTE